MVRGASSGEVRPPSRGPGLLQRGGHEPSHNPRRHLLRPRPGPPRLGVLGQGRRESDEVFGWVLRGEKVDVERFAQQTAASGFSMSADRLYDKQIGRTMKSVYIA